MTNRLSILISKAITFTTLIGRSSAGGAALYIADNLKAILRPDIKFNTELVESSWAEINAGKDKRNVIIGCSYIHLTSNLKQFRNQLNDVTKNTCS